MSGSGEGKIKLGKADVYIHVKGKSGATVTHLDIELDELNDSDILLALKGCPSGNFLLRKKRGFLSS